MEMASRALQHVVQRAYDVFGAYAAPGHPLNVCTHCCMPEALEREMRTLPLRELGAHHFREYCTGAKSTRSQAADEVKYLLPRWLELLAAGEQLHHSVELVLDRVGLCPPEAFSQQEMAVLDAYMLAYFDCCLDGESGDPLELLIMADLAGVRVAPLLRHWTCHPGVEATVHFVDSTYWGFWPAHAITNAFANDRVHLQTAFKDWIVAPGTKAAFIAKLLHPDFLARADQVHGTPVVPFSLMVDAVFDHLSYE